MVKTEVTAPSAKDTTAATKDTVKPKGEILSRKAKGEIVQKIKTEKTGVMNPVEYEQTKMMARDFVESGSLPSSFSNEHQVLIALLAGREMGMTPIESLNSLYMVNGKLSIWGSARARQLRRLGWRIKFVDGEDECTASVEKDGEGYEETVNFTEAEQSGYTTDNQGKQKVGWRKGMNRRKKLRYMALDLIVDSYIAEAKGGVIGTAEVVMDAPNFDNETKETTEDNIRTALSNRQVAKAAKPTAEGDNEKVS